MDKCVRLADEICTLLQSGIQLDPQSLSYIDSTFSNPSSRQVEAIIKDPDHCERDTLIELISFPDERLQLKIETLLECGRYGRQDEQALVGLLVGRRPEALIRFSDGRSDIRLTLTPEAIAPFVARLRITRHLPGAIIGLIDQQLPETHRNPVKVCLRNARTSLNENQSGFILDLLPTLANDAEILACVDFGLQFLEEAAEASDYFSALVKKRRALVHNLKKMADFRSLLDRENMETLVMRGERIPLIDIVDTQKKIAMIDKISLKVYGQTDLQNGPTIRTDHFDCRSVEDFKQLVRRLS